MAVAALAVLGGAGAGGYFFFLKKPAEASLPDDAHATKEAKPADDHAKKDDGHGDSHGEDSKAPTFVKFDPLIVPIMDADGVSQVVSMLITFEVVDEEAGKKLEGLKPRLKDAMIQNMYGMLHQKAAMEGGAVRVGYVKERLNAVAQKVMGDGVVKDVLLQMVQQNPI
jgi:flagellar FliL protein